ASVSPLLTGALLTPGWTGVLKVAGSGGSGTDLPSVPMRNALLALTVRWPAQPLSAMLTPKQVSAWPKPTPKSGTSTMFTPLVRSLTRDHPARNTVEWVPNNEPRTPPSNVGFQAIERRGLTPP